MKVNWKIVLPIAFMLLAVATKAATGETPDLPAIDTPGLPDLEITDHDAYWDYKRLNGVWYTRRKGATFYNEMKPMLSPEKYAEAMATLGEYLMAKGLK